MSYHLWPKDRLADPRSEIAHFWKAFKMQKMWQIFPRSLYFQSMISHIQFLFLFFLTSERVFLNLSCIICGMKKFLYSLFYYSCTAKLTKEKNASSAIFVLTRRSRNAIWNHTCWFTRTRNLTSAISAISASGKSSCYAVTKTCITIPITCPHHLERNGTNALNVVNPSAIKAILSAIWLSMILMLLSKNCEHSARLVNSGLKVCW